MTSPALPLPHQQTKPVTPGAIQQQKQERLVRLFRHVTEQPDEQHLHALITRYREESPP